MDKKITISQIQAAPVKVSLFKNLCSSGSKAFGMQEIERLVQYDNDVRFKTEAYRSMLKAVGKKEADAQVKQKQMPACSIAVVFNGIGKQAQHVLGFTGMAFCDIDHIKDVEAAFQQVVNDPHTRMAYRTVSGEGLRVIYNYVREQPDMPVNNVPWCAAFIKGNSHYAKLTGQEYDGQCADFVHLCGLAHDERVYINPAAEPFIITDEEILQANFSSDREQGKTRKEHPTGSCSESVEIAWPKVQSILSRRYLVFQPGQHHDYVMHAGFLFNRFGIDLNELLEWASAEWSAYNDKERESTLRSCYKHSDEHGTWKLRQKGGRKENTMITLPEITDWLKQNYDLKYDEVTDLTYCRTKGSAEWEEVNSRMVCTLRRNLAEETGKRVLKNDVQDVIWSDVAVLVHPVRDYLLGLPQWDGIDRVAQLASSVNIVPTQAGQSAKEAQNLFEWAFHKWMIGNVGMWLSDEIINHEMLILVGPQGIYKSTFFRCLLPVQLRNFYWENKHNSFSSKDDHIALGENCLAQVEEFNITTAHEIGVLKSLITSLSIKERRPYARQRDEKHRLAGFCGTCNEQQFLTDDTGNRRFLCFLTSNITPPNEWGIDYDQLYAQLRDEYQSGAHFWFNLEEEQRMELQNAAFKLESDEEMLIRTFIRKPQGNELGELMNAATILQYINGGRVGFGLSSKKVGTVMKKLKFPVRHLSNGNFYYVVKVPQGRIQSELEQDNTENEVQEPQQENLPF